MPFVFSSGGVARPGMLNPDGTVSYGMSGFGRDPVRPFTTNGDPVNNSTTPATVLSLNRNPTFFEWKNDRLGDLDNDSMLDYGDFLSKPSDHLPYIYFSSYDGSGYDPNDQNIVELSDSNLARSDSAGCSRATSESLSNRHGRISPASRPTSSNRPPNPLHRRATPLPGGAVRGSPRSSIPTRSSSSLRVATANTAWAVNTTPAPICVSPTTVSCTPDRRVRRPRPTAASDPRTRQPHQLQYHEARLMLGA